MKVVDIVARIPKHLDLYFYDFSTILFRIYKFAGFEKKRKRKRKLASRPLEVCFFSAWVPGGHWRTEEGRAAVFRRGEAPAVGGKVGEKGEGTEPHLWVPGIGVGAACVGVPVEEQRRRRVWTAAAALR